MLRVVASNRRKIFLGGHSSLAEAGILLTTMIQTNKALYMDRSGRFGGLVLLLIQNGLLHSAHVLSPWVLPLLSSDILGDFCPT